MDHPCVWTAIPASYAGNHSEFSVVYHVVDFSVIIIIVIILSLSRILSLTVLIKSDIKSNCAYPEILSFFRSFKLILSWILSLSIELRIMSYIKSIWDCVLSRMISPTVIIQIY